MDKELKQVSITIPNSLPELNEDIELLISTLEKEQINYLVRHVYKSTLSDSIKQKLELIFSKNRKHILEIVL